MSDIRTALKEEAANIEEMSFSEEGTLAAYWRGYAQGLRRAASLLSKEYTNEQMRAWMMTKTKPRGKK